FCDDASSVKFTLDCRVSSRLSGALYGIGLSRFLVRFEVILTQPAVRICFCGRTCSRHRSSDFRLYRGRCVGASSSAGSASRTTSGAHGKLPWSFKNPHLVCRLLLEKKTK